MDGLDFGPRLILQRFQAVRTKELELQSGINFPALKVSRAKVIKIYYTAFPNLRFQ